MLLFYMYVASLVLGGVFLVSSLLMGTDHGHADVGTDVDLHADVDVHTDMEVHAGMEFH